jgi:hypothetical protein
VHGPRELAPSEHITVEASGPLDVTYIQDEVTEFFDFHARSNGTGAHYLPKVVRRLPVVAMSVVVVLVAGLVAVRSLTHHGASAAPPAPAPSIPSTVAPTTPAPTTTSDPGLLPQTGARPSGTDPAFQARMKLLWDAIATGHVGVALPAFFPLAAYKKVKTLADPGSDWLHRLVVAYDSDIAALHSSMGAGPMSFTGTTVPDASATWVAPGSEANKIGYWRVYNSTLNYTAGGAAHKIVVISLISWRGQWYVVHFRTPPR